VTYHPPRRDLEIVCGVVGGAAEADDSKSCQRGMPECAAGFSARRDRKNDVDMMSNYQPSLRAIANVFGTLGDSMKPNFRVTGENVWLNCSIRTRSPGSIRASVFSRRADGA
jgi:hypothetical protein